MTTPRFLKPKPKEDEKSKTDESKLPSKFANFGGTLTLTGIKKKKKK